MTLFPKKNIIGSFLTVFLMVGGSSITLTSCFSNPEEPKMETPDDPNVETPVEPENPDDEKDPDENGDVNKPAEEFTLPEAFTYPYSYVVLPDDILIQTPEQVKEYTGFTVSFNKDNHTPNYVVWELKASETTGSVDRNDYSYWVDKDLEGCLDIDYAYNTYKYERGHMCPAADQKWSEAAMYDCMVMANMGPQYKSLNSGLWGTLENMSRTWAKRDGAIWIIAGPVYYPEDTLYIGRAKARVPSAYFKAF
ncbi:MAG: DNA/RNA non-specific endonuclease, partial [Muribaculaceae bacterium]|nr:DNA/RNA non-specific endonuclease [Muribaculaceae bacterium]